MKATFLRVSAAAATALLTGCAAQIDNRAAKILSTMHDAQISLNGCISDTYNDPQFEPLGSHLPMNMRGVSMDQLRNEHFATDDEITMLELYEESASGCRKSYLETLRPVVPTVAFLTAETYSRNRDNLVDLMRKKMSWGAYISGVVSNYRELTPKVGAELERLTNNSNEGGRTK